MEETYYISNNLQRALDDTGLALDELECIVGRFTNRSSRAGLLKGKVVVTYKSVEIHKCFGRGLLWKV